MDEHNPYRAPESRLAEISEELELAGRGTRLLAALLDGLLLIVVVFPLMYFGGYFAAAMDAGARGEQVPMGLTIVWTAISFAIFVAVQGYPLAQNGQTWGKKLLSIRIVDLAGQKPPLGRLLAMRYLPLQVVSSVPLVGSLAALVNVLFIFREDRRCVHDLIAGTRVVVAR